MVEMAATAMGGGSQRPAVVWIAATLTGGDGSGDDNADESSRGGVDDGGSDGRDGCGVSSDGGR